MQQPWSDAEWALAAAPADLHRTSPSNVLRAADESIFSPPSRHKSFNDNYGQWVIVPFFQWHITDFGSPQHL